MRKLRIMAVLGLTSLFMAATFWMGSRLEARSSNSSSSNNSSSSSRNGSNSSSRNGNSSSSSGGYSDGYADESEEMRSYYRWGYRSAVGGFSIDAENVLRNAPKEEVSAMTKQVRSLLAEIPADLDKESPVRKVSLRRLGELLTRCEAEGTPVPDEALFLGGLTGIDYVVAVPEENDIYLAGPAEGWTINDEGIAVGKTTGRPVLLLDDLLTVFRAWNTANPEVISCSIDPTQDAIARMTALAMTTDPEANAAANKEAMGLMDVTFTGIPANSRMATVLAAADYKMKSLSLGFESAPIEKFPSYFSMIKRSAGSYGQRFWISPEYKTIKHDSKSLAWNLSASTVKTMTEREYFAKDGSRKVSGKKDANANRWAETMTNRYADLAAAVPVFAEAKNCMDLALVAALVVMENLPQKAGCDLSALTNSEKEETSEAAAETAPQKVPSDSLCRTLNSKGDLVSVTGGISINPFVAVENNQELDESLDTLPETIAFTGDRWIAD